MAVPADVGQPDPPSAPLAGFAAANDAAAATAKKLAKQAALATYLRGLGEADLARAARYAAGRPFAATDERVLGVSGAAVSGVILDMFALDADDWRARLVRNGEVGEAMAELWQEQIDPRDPDRFDPDHTPPLTLADLQETWDALAAVGRPEAKRDLLRDLFARVRTPREAAYVGKIIFSDLRTGVREGVLHAAIAEAFGRDLEAVRRAVLLVGDVGDVALLAKRDELAAAAFRLFHPISFMLATPVESPEEAAAAIAAVPRASLPVTRPEEFDPTNSPQVTSNEAQVTTANPAWLAEHKLDGIRAQIHKQADPAGGAARVAIYTRTMDRADDSFPDVVAHARTVPGDWLLDGEIVPFDDAAGAVLPFAVIQRRLGRKNLTEELLAQYPVRFVAFDLLYRDGAVLLDRPLADRRAAMADLIGPGGALRLSPAVEVRTAGDVAARFEEARAARNEGLILKDPTSPYTPGRRGGAWLKLKTHLPTLDVVVTAAEHGHGRRRNVLSDYTFAVWDRDFEGDPDEAGARLVNVGKAFSGVTDAEIDQLTALFLSIQTGKSGRVYTVRPQVVFEVAFDAIQQSARHAGGFALRFPRIKRVRWDRSAASADRLSRVRAIWEHEQNFNRLAGPHAPAAAAAPGRRRPRSAEQPGLFD